MRQCPECDKIYDDTWKVCLNCETALVSTLSPEEENLEIEKLKKAEAIRHESDKEKLKKILKIVLERETLIKVVLALLILVLSVSLLKSCGNIGRRGRGTVAGLGETTTGGGRTLEQIFGNKK